MIYKAVEVIWIFSAGRDGTGRAGIEGTIRGPRGPKKKKKSLIEERTMAEAVMTA